MLLDLHCHTSGISKCCLIPAPEVLKRAKQVGLDGIVLTNHYFSEYVKDNNFELWLEEYIQEFIFTKKCAVELGVKAFFGVEVTMEFNPKIHVLLYGADFDFLRKYKKLYDYSLKDLYELCHKNKICVVQAHPFRKNCTVQDTKFLDGVEINCHPIYDRTNSDILPSIAQKNHLILTCGCDYHGDTPYRAFGGTYIPDEIKNERELANYLLNTKTIKLRIQEINDYEYYDREFKIKR